MGQGAKGQAAIDGLGLSVRAVLPLVGYMRVRDPHFGSLLASAGIEASVLAERDAWLRCASAYALWRGAVATSSDRQLGLRVLSFIDPRVVVAATQETEYTIVQLAFTSATVGEAVERFARYYPVTHGRARATCATEARGRIVRFAYPYDESEPPPALLEFAVGLLARILSQATDGRFVPVEMRFRHEAQGELAVYKELFAAPVVFGATEDGIVISPPLWRLPLSFANPKIAAALVKRAEGQLAHVEHVDSWGERVRFEITNALHGANPSAAAVARKLDVSVRHLARLLRAEGTSHQEILGRARSELARQYVVGEGKPFADVAPLLGYSDASALKRAFKRWFPGAK